MEPVAISHLKSRYKKLQELLGSGMSISLTDTLNQYLNTMDKVGLVLTNKGVVTVYGTNHLRGISAEQYVEAVLRGTPEEDRNKVVRLLEYQIAQCEI
jgi:hypothetical protein